MILRRSRPRSIPTSPNKQSNSFRADQCDDDSRAACPIERFHNATTPVLFPQQGLDRVSIQSSVIGARQRHGTKPARFG